MPQKIKRKIALLLPSAVGGLLQNCVAIIRGIQSQYFICAIRVNRGKKINSSALLSIQ
jgi:hypothetical protein